MRTLLDAAAGLSCGSFQALEAKAVVVSCQAYVELYIVTLLHKYLVFRAEDRVSMIDPSNGPLGVEM